MTGQPLENDALGCLNYIHARFTDTMQGRPVEYPLADTRACRAFADCVNETLTFVRSSESRLPPVALILAMIRVCQGMMNPADTAYQANVIPRAFAYEMLDRLRAEIPVSLDFALDQVGRIITEAGTQDNVTSMRKAFLAHQLRMQGAFAWRELEQLVSQTWGQYFPRSLGMLAPGLSQAA